LTALYYDLFEYFVIMSLSCIVYQHNVIAK